MVSARSRGIAILLFSIVSSCCGEDAFGRPDLAHDQRVDYSLRECVAPQSDAALDAISMVQLKDRKLKGDSTVVRNSEMEKEDSDDLSDLSPRMDATDTSVQVQEKLKPMQWENSQVKVVYGVFTSPLPKYAKQLEAVLDTWAKDVLPGKLLVVGVSGTNPNVTYRLAPMCKEGHVSNDGISCKEATLLTEGYAADADWVVILGSDNYVFVDNFEEELSRRDPEIPQILAIWGCGAGEWCKDKEGGICGGGGYAISRAALDKMIGSSEDGPQKFIQESMRTAAAECGYWSDQVTSCIARRSHVQQVPLAGLYGWRVCGEDLALEVECPWNPSNYRSLVEKLHPPSLTFHYITPNEMYQIHKMKLKYESTRSLLHIAHSDGQNEAESVAAYEKQRIEYVRLMNSVIAPANFSMH